MRLYYRGPDALITAGQFVWLGKTPQVYAIADLRGERLTRHSPKTTWQPAAAAAVLILAPGYPLLDSWISRVSLAGFGLLVASLALVWGRAGRRFELRAGEKVIYSTVDERTFNQVARALQRVMESYPGVRPHTGAVAA
jgi:hypothetical protein